MKKQKRASDDGRLNHFELLKNVSLPYFLDLDVQCWLESDKIWPGPSFATFELGNLLLVRWELKITSGKTC